MIVTIYNPKNRPVTDTRPQWAWCLLDKEDNPILCTAANTWEQCIIRAMGKAFDVQDNWRLLQEDGYKCVKIFFTGIIVEHAPE